MGVCSSENLKSKKFKESKKEINLKSTLKKEEIIIQECNTNNAPPISERMSKNLYNSISRINVEYKGENIIGTGFFIKFNLKNETKLFLATCYHIIQKKFVDEKITITLYYGKFGKEKKINIKLDKNKRLIKCFDRQIDVTLIEIIKKDNIKSDKYLVPDLNYKNGLNLYKSNFFYLAGYPRNNLNENERSISSGKITDIINKAEFEHSLSTGPGNSGSPICYCVDNNLFAVGIHKQANKTRLINYGTFLGYILDNLENENKKVNKTGMLDNINSLITIERIFSFLYEKRKFKMIKYNKMIQNKVGISLIHYKYLSGRYIKYEEKGKGKEYCVKYDKLLYEGEYLNGERNGKGKEYDWNGIIIYKGDYLNGKRWNGKGKEYYYNGELKFVGEYLKGKEMEKEKNMINMVI